LKFRVSGRVSRPIAEVFDAVVDPASLSAYFTTGGAKGRLATGTTVTWDFADFPGAFPVEVISVVANEKIVLRWGGTNTASRTEVTMNFTDTGDGRTLVEISEHGWPETEDGLASSYGNCMGWSQMICALKMWVEHGINLRDRMYI